MERIYKYHCQIGFPELKLPQGVITIKRVSKHAEHATRTDRYAPEGIKLPKTVDTSRARLIECDALADGDGNKGRLPGSLRLR